jgi:ribonuclease R
VRDGEIVKIRGNRYGLPEKMNLAVGRITVHPDGYAFLVTETEGEEDIYIGPRNLKGAMHKDKAVVRVEHEERGGGRTEGTVIRVLERANTKVVGRYQRMKNFGVVVSTNPRLTSEFYVPAKESAEAKDGDMVVAEITAYPETYRSAEVKVTRVLGRAGLPGLDTDIVIEEMGLATEFSPEAMAEAEKVSQKVPPEAWKGRRDLRGVTTVTIDGERARDFDDAVAVQDAGKGHIRLYVSIADVAHYVKPGSGIDTDAHERATSVYFPDRVLPMLPEALSNGICSLRPDEDRLTLTCEMVFNERGERMDYEVYESAIKSKRRMTYTEVAGIIEKDDPEMKERHADLVPEFLLMHELSKRLNLMRKRRGSIDFDLPEPEVLIDVTGKTTSIIKSERNEAHRLIEEFMLAANESVASHLELHGVPFLFRVHDEPDEQKMAELGDFVKGYGLPWPGEGSIRPKHLANLLEKAAGKPQERLINNLVLRSMKLAKYSPENAGHFGLASRCYCHFTSPIRRYPDLIVHRAVKELIRKKTVSPERKGELAAELPALGQHTSFMEREAEQAERKVVELKKLQFMIDKIGMEFTGHIAGVTAFGFFVELEEFFVEGLVRLTSLYDDYYSYDERAHALVGSHTGRVFRLGDKVEVSLERVDLERRQMDFYLVGMAKGQRDFEGHYQVVPYVPAGKRAGETKQPGAARKRGGARGANAGPGKPAGKPAGRPGARGERKSGNGGGKGKGKGGGRGRRR